MRSFLTALCCVSFLMWAPVARSQSGQGIFVTPIPNAPFSAVVNVQRSFVQPNGGVMNFRTSRGIGRDNQGRIYSESTTMMADSNPNPPVLLGIHLYDPQTRISTMLDIRNQTYRTGTVNRPPETVPPALLYAAPAGNNLPQNQYVKEEDLGVHEIEGVSAHGVRETQTIPAASSGTDKDVVVTDEYWYSEDLRINLSISHNDPRTGSVTMTVAKIVRTDPDPSRFVIPEGYKQAVPAVPVQRVVQ